jgi:hypothetical protein
MPIPGLHTKEREFRLKIPASEWTFAKGSTWFSSGGVDMGGGSQVTDSVGHVRAKDGKYHSGGPFRTVRFEQSLPTVQFSSVNPYFPDREAFRGYMGTPMKPSSIAKYLKPHEDFRSSDLSDLDPLGATAVSLCAPTNSASDLGVGLSELVKEKLPSLPGVQTWRQRTKIAKAAGSEYLNTVFGWLPLVSEIKDVGGAVRHSRDILDQYHRDEGHNVRREFEFPIEKSVDTYVLGEARAGVNHLGEIPFPWMQSENAGTLTQTVETVKRSWFSGCFTYALPSRSDSWNSLRSSAADADKLFGITLAPDIVWELTPWSWAIDWFSNTGDVIHNVSQFGLQGLIMRYGYMMEEQTTTITHRLDHTGILGLDSVPPSTFTMTSKVRGEANPFGFGIGWEGLSPTQLAITAALGITRLR